MRLSQLLSGLNAGRGSVTQNTINICIGHKPFPIPDRRFVDVILSPKPMEATDGIALHVIDDASFGKYGHTLSEFSQLSWLRDHFEEVCGGADYVRLFQYRKFVSPNHVGRKSAWGHARWIKPTELENHANEFSRFSRGEVFSRPLGLKGGFGRMATQYAENHKLEDLYLFCAFLLREGVFDDRTAMEFCGLNDLVPSATLGVYRRQTLQDMLNTLAHAAEFINSPYFIEREGLQRRNAGFLLERLHSHLILRHIAQGAAHTCRGRIIVISDGPNIGVSS